MAKLTDTQAVREICPGSVSFRRLPRLTSVPVREVNRQAQPGVNKLFVVVDRRIGLDYTLYEVTSSIRIPQDPPQEEESTALRRDTSSKTELRTPLP